MKTLIRYAMALPIVLPFIAFVQVMRLLVGKDKAVQLCGPYVTSVAKIFLKIILPQIERPEDFDLFRAKTKANFWMWKPLYDFDVEQDSADILQLKIRNCPFCELAALAGVPELNYHVCRGDWEFAKENEGKWKFEREHEIGKGDRFCDHTYKRIA